MHRELKSLENSSDLKLADVTSCYKKKSKASENNYRPKTILPNVSKTSEKCIYKQMQQYLEICFLNINVIFGRVVICSTV